jgi:hypothetical protein
MQLFMNTLLLLFSSIFHFFVITGLQEGVEIWMLIDARETRLVSAILFQIFENHWAQDEAVLHEGNFCAILS